MDHMSGLHNFFWKQGVNLTAMWTTRHSKSFNKAEFENCPYEWNDWATYAQLRKGNRNNEKVQVLNPMAGDDGELWSKDGIKILSPTPELLAYCNKTDDWNDSSLVLAIEYGGRRVILPGDAEKPA
jgi:beta-lactamase superfamily II metal-dependent hydrolase